LSNIPPASVLSKRHVQTVLAVEAATLAGVDWRAICAIRYRRIRLRHLAHRPEMDAGEV
jgi:hypothetical protein